MHNYANLNVIQLTKAILISKISFYSFCLKDGENSTLRNWEGKELASSKRV